MRFWENRKIACAVLVVCIIASLLTGGGAFLHGIGALITQKTGIRVNMAKKPFDSVCSGIGRVIESESMMGDILRYRGR